MDLNATLRQFYRQPDLSIDLVELALHLARDEYPDVDVEAYLGELDGMAHEARRFLGGNLESQVTGLCRYLFHEMGFHGNDQDYYDARNSYLNQVIDRRTGIPITLTVLAMAVGNRAGLSIVGVGLPGHFIAKAIGGGQHVLFDPFHGGRLLSAESCEILVQQTTGDPFEATPDKLEATPAGEIVQRMLNNLKIIYLRAGDFPRAVRVIQRLRQLNPLDPLQQRDLGVSLFQAGQPGKAIDHLTAYVSLLPEANDADSVRQILDQARQQIAGWN